jgi:hypothetical protein
MYTRHPVFRMITPDEAVRNGKDWFEKMVHERELAIHLAATDPLNHGWEPPVFEVADALLEVNWFEWGTGTWEEKRDLNRRFREHLGFPAPVTALLVNGGNQIGKTEYAAKRLMLTMLSRLDAAAWWFHSSEDMSKAKGSHQPLCWKYMPKNLKTENGIKTGTTYIAFKEKTGFSDNGFILPNKSAVSFKFYGQDQDKAMQGPNIFAGLLDELFPLSWIQDVMFRVAKQGGWVLGTFTPKNGYSASCAWFYEGAEIVKSSVAFMLPADGKGPDLARSLGFANEEAYALAYERGRDSHDIPGYGPNSIPENCRNWLEGKPSQPAVPEGRSFETVPRVMRCTPLYFNGKWRYNRAVLFFHSSDGPFGNPVRIIEDASTQGKTEIRWRVYGHALKLTSALIGNFDTWQVCKAESIPAKGTNYHFMDPAPGRNPFQTWFRICGLDVYLYREWPGNYEIPGVGMPGPWVEPSDKHPDGAKGSAQDSFNWGILKFKQEIARLEGWKDFRADGKNVQDWSESGAKERISLRYMDSRAASSPKLENDRSTTLLTMFDDVGLNFLPTPAEDVQSGVEAIRDLLDWTPEDDRDPTRMRLHVSEECVNTIACLRMWTNAEGQKGACKDPIDNIRYFALSDLQDDETHSLAPLRRNYG